MPTKPQVWRRIAEICTRWVWSPGVKTGPKLGPLQGTHWVMEARVRARLDAKLWLNHKEINWS